MCTQVVIDTALCAQIRHSGGHTSKTYSAPCDTKTALTEAAAVPLIVTTKQPVHMTVPPGRVVVSLKPSLTWTC
jgi:hypothetical protein